MVQKNFINILVICIILLGNFNVTYSQTTRIRGKITDTQTKEPIPFATISLKKTTVGTITDVNGDYFIETKALSDSIEIACMGFTKKVIPIKSRKFQTIDVELSSTEFSIQEVTVTPKGNPALVLLDKVVDNKERNNQNNLDFFQYEVYNKVEVDINNVDDKFRQNKALRKIQFVFDYADTNVVTGKVFLPILISESLSDYYYRREPKAQREIIKANKMSGVDNESVAQFTGQMYQDFDLYDTYLTIFDQPFINPISAIGKLYYRYYLIDSAFIENQWCYEVSYKPRRKQEFTFMGEFWVNDTSFAIKKAKLRISDDVNMNYINDYVAEFEYDKVGDTWFQVLNNIFVDFNLTDKSKGFFGKKTTSFKNIIVNQQPPKEIFQEKTNIVVNDDALKKDDDFWEDHRHVTLSNKEEGIYNMVDSVKNLPVFRTFADIVTAFITGYYDLGKYEFGPYYTTFSHNEIEGYRMRLGGRTSTEFSTKMMVDGHVAVGSKDQKFKYGLGLTYIFSQNPRQAVRIYYKDDMEQLGKSQNAFLDDNILSTILQRNPFNKITPIRNFQTYYEKEWISGLSNKITFDRTEVFSTEYVRFFDLNSQQNLNSLTSTTISLNTRFAFHEQFVYGNFDKLSLGSDYPIVNLEFTTSLKDVLGCKHEFYKINFNVSHYFNIATFGYLKYTIDAGKIYGTVPYPFLRLHEGNETYAYDDFAFNMMNYYEFASDKYLSFSADHHFMGLFLNKIPLLRKLKFREVANVKGLIGELSDKHQTIVEFPQGLNAVSKPYFEAGIGVENILKIIRIDAIWRLSYLDHPDIQKFGIRASLQLVF